MTPAPIWWCVVYNEGKLDRFDFCDPEFPEVDGDGNHENCGPRRLVDVGALIVERDAAGNWPLSILDAIGEKVRVDPWLVQAVIEDALELSDTDSCKAPEAST